MSGYFCATNNASYTISGGILTFNTASADPDSGWDGSSEYTVPAAWNDRYAIFNINFRASSPETRVRLVLERSVDGGTIWTRAAAGDGSGSAMEAKTFTSKPIKMVTGDKYRCGASSSTAVTIHASTANNFNAMCLGGYGFGQDYAKLSKNVDQNITGFQTVTWQVADEDTNGLITSFDFVIPGGYPKSIALYHAMSTSNVTTKQGMYFAKTGGYAANSQCIHASGDKKANTLITEVVAGDILTQSYWNSSGTKVLLTGDEMYSTLTLFNVE